MSQLAVADEFAKVRRFYVTKMILPDRTDPSFSNEISGRHLCFLEVRLEMAQLKHKYVWVAQPSDRPQR